MCFACWIIQATNTLKICNTYRFSMAVLVLWMRLKCCVYTYIACLVVSSQGNDLVLINVL
jgi:hypothetical protein